MKIGIITYEKFAERVTLDTMFNMDDLFNIMLTDNDYVKFQIIDENENLVLSTHYPETGDKIIYIEILCVKREVEILGTTYDA
ncbi:hypothetical protein [Chryseobacterium sp. SIMBA_029]|uniref:hypothetical protein n=1 Tax=Chryseobacterium sp. SIMBA_029 TaxID=3085772 RepID=UPI00397E336A